MAKININFNNTDYQVDESALASATNDLKQHLSTTMAGTGATINLGGITYNIDSTKLSTATNDFVSHLGTIAGNGTKVTVGGVEYNIGSDKVSGAVEILCTVFSDLSSPKPSEGLAYTLNSDGVTYSVANSACTDTDIVIASEYDGLPVTSIGKNAFQSCSKLTSIIIPDSVTNIGDYAFQNCFSLTSITIPANVTSIGYNAFYGCHKLIEVYNLSSLNITADSSDYGYVGKYAKNVYTPTSGESKLFTDSNGYIFYDDGTNRYLMGYTGDSTVLNLPASCNGCNYEIYKYAFYKRDDLTSVTIPASVTSIGERAFQYCSNLTTITIPDSVTSIGGGAFQYCGSLKSITIPASVTSIGNNTFQSCFSLTSIMIPDSVTSIGNNTFQSCTQLTSIMIPDSVTSIGREAFYSCGKLSNITYTGTISQWNTISKGTFWKKGSGITYIQCSDGQLTL